MKPELIISVISLIISLASFLGAVVIFAISSRRENHQNLLQRVSVFYSPEIHMANQRLWNLYREYGEEGFLGKYIEIMNKENQDANALPIAERMEFQRGTLHYQRRVVSSFWRGTAILIKYSLVPRNVVLKWWSRDDVEIVNKIIIPIEDRVADYLRVSRLNPKTDPLYYLVSIRHRFYKT